MRLFITRPQPDASLSAQKLEKEGNDVLLSPLLSINFIKSKIPENCDAYIFTSRNGVRASEELTINKNKLVFTVGNKTAALARKNGFQNVLSANGNVENLVDLITSFKPKIKGTMVHLSGEHTKRDLTKESGFNILKVVVYEAKPVETLPQNLEKAIKTQEIDAGVFYSARTATTFKALVNSKFEKESFKSLAAFVLSDDIKEVIKDMGWANIFVAKSPNENSLIDKISENKP